MRVPLVKKIFGFLVIAFMLAATMYGALAAISPQPSDMNGLNFYKIRNFTEIGTSNITFNNSGYFFAGNKILVTAPHYLVCVGQNAADNVKKSAMCDYVCLSTATDCSTPINNALLAANASTTKRTVLLDGGNYTIGAVITIPSNVRLLGSGVGITIFKKAAGYTGGDADTIRTINSGTTPLNNIELGAMSFDSSNDNSSTVGVGRTVHFEGVDNLYLHNLYVFNSSAFSINVNNGGLTRYIDNFVAENILIEYPRQINDGFGGGGFKNCRLNNIHVIRETTGAYMDFTNRDGCTFSNIILEGTSAGDGSWGFSGDFNMTNETWNNIIVKNSDFCIYIGKDSHDITGTNIQCLGSRRSGFFLDGFTGNNNIYNIKMDNVIIKGWGNSGFHYALVFKNASNNTFTNIQATEPNDTNDGGIQLQNTAENNQIFDSQFKTGLDVSFATAQSVSYIDFYKYSSLPTCASQNILDRKTIFYNDTPTTTQKCTCLSGTWNCEYFDGTNSWTNLTNFPVACPAGTYVTQINKSITCTAYSTNANLVTNLGLILYVPGDNNIADHSGTGIITNMVGNVAYNTTNFKTGYAMTFNGSSTNYVNTSLLTYNTSDLTITAWIYPLDTTAYYQIAGMQGSDSITLQSPSGKVYWQSNGSVVANTSLTLNAWNFVAATVTGNTVTHYLNGVKLNSGSLSGRLNITTAARTWKIGYVDSTALNGSLDELKVFNRVMTDSEILSEYQRVTPVDPAPVALTLQTLTVSNNLTLPLNNFPTCAADLAGNVRYNTTSNHPMYCNTTAWVQI